MRRGGSDASQIWTNWAVCSMAPGDRPLRVRARRLFRLGSPRNLSYHQVLRDNGNRWMATREIQQAFQDHNKSVHYNALDMTLKSKDKIFEIRKDPARNRNQFRLKGEA